MKSNDRDLRAELIASLSLQCFQSFLSKLPWDTEMGYSTYTNDCPVARYLRVALGLMRYEIEVSEYWVQIYAGGRWYMRRLPSWAVAVSTMYRGVAGPVTRSEVEKAIRDSKFYRQNGVRATYYFHA